MSDILVECTKGCLQAMLDVLQDYQPRHIQQYNFIYNYLYHYDTLNQNREGIYSDRWNIRFYTHCQGDPENCTLITINGSKDYIIICFTLQKSRQELTDCLQQTNLINWHNYNFLMISDETIFETLNEVANQKLPIKWNHPPSHHVLHISKDKITGLPLEENLPDDLYLAPLDPMGHAKIIDDHWFDKAENSLCLIRQSIELNGGIGLFRHGQEQPISWIATNVFFSPGFLHTIKPERGRGFGQLMLKLELKRLLKQHDIDLFTFVMDGNTVSLNLHQKLGFDEISQIKFLEKPI